MQDSDVKDMRTLGEDQQPLIDPYREYEFIRVWPWTSAPPSLTRYSTHGGDEDGVIWIPNKFLGETLDGYPLWLEAIWRGYGSQDFFRFRDGMLVIWAHA